MPAPRRERDDRRSVGSHEKMMAALGRAAGWTRYTTTVGSDDPKIDGKSVVIAKKINSERRFVPGRGNVNDNDLPMGVTYGQAGVYGANVKDNK
jgi:hypothetical protein